MGNLKETILRADGLSKTYWDADRPIQVLDKLTFTLTRGEVVAIMGRSGSGKTTFLNVLGGLDIPTEGQVYLNNVALHALTEQTQAGFRNEHIGFIYQFHHLLPEFTAQENVAMPLLIAKMPPKVALEKAAHLLEQVGLGDRLTHEPSMLSGGERQRVAIARALINEPSLILADEPTGNLDHDTAKQVIELLLSIVKSKKTALIVVTHDHALAKRLSKTWVLQAGRLVVED